MGLYRKQFEWQTLQELDVHRLQECQFGQFVANEFDEVSHHYEKVEFLKRRRIRHNAHL
jgi:hypothetical protein